MKRLLFWILLLVAGSATATERNVSLKRNFGTLRGTLAEPTEKAETAVLLIAGSGPTDRNCNNSLGIKTNSFQYLAEELEKVGIASLRYDKRGIGESAFDEPEQIAATIFEDFVADAAAWVDYLAEQGYRKIVLIGHSEGALIALCVAQQNPRITAVISASGPGFPLDEVLKTQLSRQLPPSEIALYVQADKIITSLKRGEKVSDIPLPLTALFHSSVQPFLISIFRYDPRKLIDKLEIPILIVQGDNDLQIGIEDAAALAAAQPQARKVIIEEMTHLLKKSNGRTQMDQIGVYTDSTLPLDSDFTKAVIAFIGDC